LLSGFLLGSAYAVWAYAVDGRAVGASVFFSAAVIAAMMKIEREPDSGAGRTAMLGALSALAVLMHAIAVLHCLPVACWAFAKSRRHALAYAATAALLVGAVYGGCYLYVAHAGYASSFFAWALGYAGFNGAANAAHSHFWADDVAMLVRGLGTGWRDALFASGVSARGTIAVDIAALAAFGAVVAAFVRARKAASARSLSFAVFGWGAIITVFLAFWSPGQEGFRLHVIVPWLIASILSASAARWIDWALFVSAASLFALNFSFGIYPAAFIRNNAGYQTLNFIESRVARGDVVLTGTEPAVPGIEVLRPYFFPDINGGSIAGRLFAFRENSLTPLRERLAALQSEGHSIYLSDDLFEPNAQRRLDEATAMAPGSAARLVSGFKVVGILPLPNGRALKKVELKIR
jgi:hypothetical protein